MANTVDMGLELTNNSKVGWAFSLPRSKTCINATETCVRLCYGNGVRYQTPRQKAKRERNYRTIVFLLDKGGPELLAENLSMLVDRARPRDWLTARITGASTAVPFTLRIHDVGDYFSVDYVRAWSIVARKQPECAFWFYTRSFLDEDIFAAMTELAALPNCQGWLSIDSDNFREALIAKCSAPADVWKLALLQDQDLDPDVVPSLAGSVSRGQVVNFPYHRGGRHVAPLKDKVLTVCPAVTGSYALQPDRNEPRPCQLCTFCLPV